MAMLTVKRLLPLMFLIAAAPAGSDAVEEGLRGLQREDQRVATIAYRLKAAGVEICKDRAPLTGFSVQDLNQYVPAVRDAARRVFFLPPGVPAVLAVVPDSPAAKAGLQARDVLIAINDVRLKPTSTREASDAPVAAIEATIMREARSAPVTLLVGRDQLQFTISFSPVMGCASRVQLVPGKKLGASADGNVVELTSRLMEFAGHDDGVATAIAHELSHNILRHGDKLDAQGVKRGALAGLSLGRSRIRATEVEADYWGLYLVARAGYDLSRVREFMVRYAKKIDLGPFNDGTHPGKGARIALVDATLAEIRAKQQAGQPLIPNASPPVR
jgi:beta-barrel assembly-enhancing protease